MPQGWGPKSSWVLLSKEVDALPWTGFFIFWKIFRPFYILWKILRWDFLYAPYSRKSLYILTFHWLPPPIGTPGRRSRHWSRAAKSHPHTSILFSLLFFLTECILSFMQGLCSVQSISSEYCDTLLYIHSLYWIIFMYNLYTWNACKIRKTAAIVGISTFIAIS